MEQGIMTVNFVPRCVGKDILRKLEKKYRHEKGGIKKVNSVSK